MSAERDEQAAAERRATADVGRSGRSERWRDRDGHRRARSILAARGLRCRAVGAVTSDRERQRTTGRIRRRGHGAGQGRADMPDMTTLVIVGAVWAALLILAWALCVAAAARRSGRPRRRTRRATRAATDGRGRHRRDPRPSARCARDHAGRAADRERRHRRPRGGARDGSRRGRGAAGRPADARGPDPRRRTEGRDARGGRDDRASGGSTPPTR